MFITQSPFQTNHIGMAPGLGHQNPMMNMFGLMAMMMKMMQMVMTMMGGHSPMAHRPGTFGGGGGSPMVGGSPLGSFLGGGSPGYAQSGPGGVAQTGGAFAPQTDGSISPKTNEFINHAKSMQGAPYVFGASGNGKYDCSGLVYAALKKAGVKVPRLAARGYQDMFKNSKVSKENLKPGDLVFFHSKNTRGIPQGRATHIEIYLGNGMTMGTDSPKEGARIEPINWKTFIGGARVPQLNS